MKRTIFFVLSLVLLLAAFPSVAICDEKDVLKALETIKGNTETGVTFSKYNELLASAKVEINIAKRTLKNKAFISSAEACLVEYEIAREHWKTLIEISEEFKYFAGLTIERKKVMQKCWDNAAVLLEKTYAALQP